MSDRAIYTQKHPDESSPIHESRWNVLEMTPAELRNVQLGDPTLEIARRVTEGNKVLKAGKGFYFQDGLLYCHWEPKNQNQSDRCIRQLVLPTSCREAVMAIAHEIPLGGHLGKTKTTQRLLQRFYWPTLYSDVERFCRNCKACQLDSPRRVHKAPLIPLPIISEPFRRVAMNIVGPLPKSRSGKNFVLVVRDYATR